MEAASKVILLIAKSAAEEPALSGQKGSADGNELPKPPQGVTLLTYAAHGVASNLASHAAEAQEGNHTELGRWVHCLGTAHFNF